MIVHSESSAQLSAIDSSGRGIRIRFLRHDGRFLRQIEVVDGGPTHTLLESIEGEGDPDWPSSSAIGRCAWVRAIGFACRTTDRLKWRYYLTLPAEPRVHQRFWGAPIEYSAVQSPFRAESTAHSYLPTGPVA